MKFRKRSSIVITSKDYSIMEKFQELLIIGQNKGSLCIMVNKAKSAAIENELEGNKQNWKNLVSVVRQNPSSETQGQIVGARESLNGRKNMARRKVKNGERSPWGQCLTGPVPSGRRRSGFWLVPFGTGLVRHCPQGLLSPFFTFLCAIFFRPFRLSLAPTICPWVSEDG